MKTAKGFFDRLKTDEAFAKEAGGTTPAVILSIGTVVIVSVKVTLDR